MIFPLTMAVNTVTPCKRCRQMSRIPPAKPARRRRETKRNRERIEQTITITVFYSYGHGNDYRHLSMESGPPTAMVTTINI